MNRSQDQQRKLDLLGTPAKLPLSVAIQVAYGSIRVRLTRSLVTVSSVVLAVTFLLVVLGGEIASNAVFRTWVKDVQPVEDSAQLRTLLLQPRSSLMLITALRDQPEDTAEWAASYELGLPAIPDNAASTALIIAHWIEGLRPSQRYLIVRNQTIGRWLLTFHSEGAATDGTLPGNVRRFLEEAAAFTGTRLPITPEEVLQLSVDMTIVSEAVRQLEKAEQRRLQQIQEHAGPETVIAALREGSDDTELTAMGAPLPQLILGITNNRRQELVAQLRIEHLRSQAQSILAQPRLITDEAGEETVASILGLGSLIDGRLEGHPLSTPINEELLATLGADNLGRLRHDLHRRRTLDGLRSTFSSMNYDPESGKERTLWLVLLSLLVCIVGIVNSMMMAVTERFREIATMKCLGAMDGFILKTFMIESGSVGFVGAILGAVIGIILVLIQSTTRFGGSFWASLPTQYLFMAAVASLFCGLVLTIIGALLPAYKAARMHPIEAMRLEA